MKKLLALLLAAIMVLGCVSAFADEGSEPDWTGYDARIAEIKATTDFAAREKLLHEAEDELMATGAIVPIYYYNDVYMAREGLTEAGKMPEVEEIKPLQEEESFQVGDIKLEL